MCNMGGMDDRCWIKVCGVGGYRMCNIWTGLRWC